MSDEQAKRDDDRHFRSQNDGTCCLACFLAIVDYLIRLGDKI